MRLVMGCLLVLVAAGTGFCQDGSGWWAYSPEGLNLRVEPSSKAAKVALIPFGARILPLKGEAKAPAMTVDGLTGYWVRCLYDGAVGWAFSGYLCPLPPAGPVPQGADPIAWYFGRQFDKRGEWPDWVVDAQGGRTKTLALEQGVVARVVSNTDMSFIETQYDVPWLGLGDGFLLLKSLGIFQELSSFPTANRSLGSDVELLVKKDSSGRVVSLTWSSFYVKYAVSVEGSGVRFSSWLFNL